MSYHNHDEETIKQLQKLTAADNKDKAARELFKSTDSDPRDATYWRQEYFKLKTQLDALTSHHNRFVLDFADYIVTDAWEYDYREQRTHTHAEHLEYFKGKYE